MTFRVANTPIMYMPKYTQNLKDDRMHVQVTPGKSKDWGLFILTAWRYDFLANSGGRIHLDYREKKSWPGELIIIMTPRLPVKAILKPTI